MYPIIYCNIVCACEIVELFKCCSDAIVFCQLIYFRVHGKFSGANGTQIVIVAKSWIEEFTSQVGHRDKLLCNSYWL